MTWTDKDFIADTLLTASQLNNAQADITAAMNGDDGAPNIRGALNVTSHAALQVESIAASGTWLIPKGVYTMVTTVALGAELEMLVGSSWIASTQQAPVGLIISNGSYYRVKNKKAYVNKVWYRELTE